MLENSCIPAAFEAFRSQITINPVIVAMMASFIDERIHEVFSNPVGVSFVFWLFSGIAVHC